MPVDVHRIHCCVFHGCKYDDKDCPVVEGLIKQAYICELCEDDGFESVENIPIPGSPNYDLYLMSHQDLIKECIKLRGIINETSKMG